MILHVHILYRAQTHWQGRYTEAQFNARVLPILTRANATIIKERIRYTDASGRIYEVQFESKDAAIQFRKELDYAMNLLHKKFPPSYTFPGQ